MKTSVRIGLAVGAVAVAIGVIVLTPGQGRVFIAGDKPVTELDIRAKLQADGYTDVQISRDGRWFEVRATKDGKKADLAVNAENGRLADEPFKDADEQD